MSGYRPKGFKRTRANAFWLDCLDCEDAGLFHGDTAEDDARYWVREHNGECKAKRFEENLRREREAK